jgi:hypothetical protein
MNNISYNLIEKINITFYKQLLDLEKKINLKIETEKEKNIKNNKMFLLLLQEFGNNFESLKKDNKEIFKLLQILDTKELNQKNELIKAKYLNVKTFKLLFKILYEQNETILELKKKGVLY